MNRANVQDVRVPAQVVLGGTELSLKELSQLGVGSIVALRSLAGEPVDFIVAGERIARGEVVVIDENFGVRITELIPEGR